MIVISHLKCVILRDTSGSDEGPRLAPSEILYFLWAKCSDQILGELIEFIRGLVTDDHHDDVAFFQWAEGLPEIFIVLLGSVSIEGLVEGDFMGDGINYNQVDASVVLSANDFLIVDVDQNMRASLVPSRHCLDLRELHPEERSQILVCDNLFQETLGFLLLPLYQKFEHIIICIKITKR